MFKYFFVFLLLIRNWVWF